MPLNTSLVYGNFVLNSKVKYIFRYKIDANDNQSIYKVGLIADA